MAPRVSNHCILPMATSGHRDGVAGRSTLTVRPRSGQQYGYGPGLGLHKDQAGVPCHSLNAANANATWNLTEYTKDDALPGLCARFGTEMQQPTAKAEEAVPSGETD